MAKTQKTLLVNDELLRVLDAHQSVTGVSFTRVMTAALLQYLFADHPHRNSIWMRLATTLERGEMTLPFTVAALMRHKGEHYESRAKRLADDFDSLDDFLQAVQVVSDGYDDLAQELEDTFAQADNPLGTITDWFLDPPPERTDFDVRLGL